MKAVVLIFVLFAIELNAQINIDSISIDSISLAKEEIMRKSDSIFKAIERDKLLMELYNNPKIIYGHWELDYKKETELANCGCGDEAPNYQWYRIRYGRTYINFKNDSIYRLKLWGDKSKGKYKIKEDTLFKYPSNNVENLPYYEFLHSVNEDELVIRFIECDRAHYFHYRKRRKQ